MNTGYLIYQAERPVSAAEQRAVDIQHAELSASFARLLRSLVAPLREARLRRTGHAAAPAAGVCAR